MESDGALPPNCPPGYGAEYPTWLVNLINKPLGVIISTWVSILYKKYCWYIYKSVVPCKAPFIDTINLQYNHIISYAYLGM